MVTQQHFNPHPGQSRQLAAGITFIVCLVVLLFLLLTRLSFPPDNVEVLPEPYIVMAEPEFVDVEVVEPVYGDMANESAQTPEDMANESQPAPVTGTDLSTQGPVDETVSTVITPQPSTVRETARPSAPKPAANTDAREKEEKALAKRTQNNVSNAFAAATNKNNAQTGTNDNGPSGKADGNPNSAGSNGSKAGSSSGTVGGGWKMPAYSRSIPSNEVGTVQFEVEVNRDGTVGKITVISNSGLTSATVAKCNAEIRRHKFVNSNPAEAQPATARVKFTFQDPN